VFLAVLPLDQGPARIHLPEQAFQSGQLSLQFPDGAVALLAALAIEDSLDLAPGRPRPR